MNHAKALIVGSCIVVAISAVWLSRSSLRDHRRNTPRDPATETERIGVPQTAESTNRVFAEQPPGLPASPNVTAHTFGESGRIPTLEEVPTGRLRSQLAALPSTARARALNKLAERKVPVADVSSLSVDATGQLFYECLLPGEAATLPAVIELQPPAFPMAMPAVPPVASQWHSKPGATKVIFLDFNGHTVTGTQWNQASGSRPAVGSYVCLPYDTDADPTTFNGEEDWAIFSIWYSVAEDFRPFDVDVTTEEPAVFNSQTMRVLITRSTDANGVNNPSSSSAGVAYLDVFGAPNYATYSPAFVYADRAGSSDNIRESVSHEAGHNLSLSHDGLVAAGNVLAQEYYSGHGWGETSWAPIMGSGFGRSITQWSKGEYYGANNTQDDLAILSTRLGYIQDDHAASHAQASSVQVDGVNINASGFIQRTGDVDTFKFSTLGGTSISLYVNPGVYAKNADLLVRLYNGAGELLLTSDYPYSPQTSFSGAFVGGDFYLEVAGNGAESPTVNPPNGYTAYGSLGYYSVNATVTNLAPQAPTISPHPQNALVTTQEEASFYVWAWGTPTPTFSWEFQSAGQTGWVALDDGGQFSGTKTNQLVVLEPSYTMSGGSFRCVASNSAGSATSDPASITVAGPPSFELRPLSRSVIVGQPVSFTAQAVAASAVSYQWRRNRQNIPGATASSLTIASSSLADNGNYEVVATSAAGSSRSFFQLKVVPDKLAIVMWGDNTSGQATVPVGLGKLLDARAGNGHTLALRADGTVRAWGADFHGQARIPPGLGNVIAIASGGTHGMALRSDGTVAAWGDSPWEETGPGALPPSGLNQVVAISAGWGRGGALRANGRVVTWGFGDNFQPTAFREITALAVGPFHSLALKSDGTVLGWGENSRGESTPPVGLNSVVAIAAGGSAGGAHSLALKSDGTVVAWGANVFGQCDVPAGLTNVVAIAAGGHFNLALKADGSVVGWGDNGQNQLGVPALASHGSGISAGFAHGLALIVAELPQITTTPFGRTINLHAGTTFSVAASGTAPLAYRWMRNGVTLVDSDTVSGSTTANLTLTDAQVSSAGAYSVEVSNAAGAVVSSTAALSVATPPTFSAKPLTRNVVEGQTVSFSVTVTGGAPFTYQWRHHRQTIPNQTSATLNLGAVTVSHQGYYEAIVTNAAGGVARTVFYLSVAIPNPTITVWGEYAAQVPSISGSISAISQGGVSLVLRSDGTVIGWGVSPWSPLVPEGLSSVVAIASRESHSVALKSNGTVVIWGGWDPASMSPPNGLAGVVAVALGYDHAAALKSDGTVITWGNPNIQGVPADLTDVVAIGAGYHNTVALKADGTVVSWGDFGWGTQNVPTDLADVVKISTGNNHTLALKRDGTVVVWGSDYNGTLTLPAGLSNVVEVAAGSYHSVVAKSDGTVAAWGTNYQHQTDVPPGLSNVVAVSAGEGRSMALTRTLPPSIATPPQSRTAIVGDYVTFQVAASGVIPFSYQWRRNGTNLADSSVISGSTTGTLVISSVAAAHAGSYDVVVTNTAGSATSSSATLTVKVPPLFVVRPLSRVVGLGTSTTLVALAQGSIPFTYAWKRNGSVIAGATSSSLTLSSASSADNGFYEVIATNANAASRSVFTLKVSADNTNMTVANWGEDGYGVAGATAIPSGLAEVVQVAAGRHHAAALLGDGSVNAWGVNNFGSTTIPEGLPQVAAVAAGEHHTLVLTADGRVVSWGNYSVWPEPVPPDLRNVVAISAKGNGNVALKSDGSIVTWGMAAAPDTLTEVVKIAAGEGHALALRRDGTVVAWGTNSDGECTLPGGLTGVVDIAAGSDHSLALKSNGTVVAWGRNDVGQATVPGGLSGVVSIDGGFVHSVALKSTGAGVGWGRNNEGQTEPFSSSVKGKAVSSGPYYNLVMIPIEAPAIVAQPVAKVVTVGRTTTLTVQASGTTPTYQWRKDGQPLVNGEGVSGVNTATLTIVATQTGDAGSYDVVITNSEGQITSAAVSLVVNQPPLFLARPLSRIVQVGKSVSISGRATTAAGTLVYSWRHNGRLMAGKTSSTLSISSVAFSDQGSYQVTVSNGVASNNSVFVLHVSALPVTDLSVIAWGSNNYNESTPPSSLTGIVQVAAGEQGSLALNNSGTLIGWGTFGIFYLVPPSLSNVVAVAAGNDNAIALKSDGTVTSFGHSVNDSTVTESLFDVVAVAASNQYHYALLQDGSVVGWNVATPSALETISGLSGVTQIAAGSYHLIARTSAGTVFTHADGEPNPAVSAGLTGITAVAAGQNFSAALRSNGTVVAFGDNSIGETAVPQELSNVISISSRFRHSSALKADGTLISWGSTFNGVGATLPNVYSGRVVGTACGGYHDVALVSPASVAPHFTSQPESVRVLPGDNAQFTATAAGSSPLSYKWQRREGLAAWSDLIDNSTFSGVQTSSLSILSADVTAGRSLYRCVVSNSVSSAISESAGLTVMAYRSMTDFDGDYRTELLWQNSNTTSVSSWTMAGGLLNFGAEGSDWRVIEFGDFDGDGRTELLWKNLLTNQISSWTMAGQFLNFGAESVGWKIIGVGDFDGDNRTELLWRNLVTTQISAWTMAGGFLNFGPESAAWSVSRVGDFDGDGRSELLWRNSITTQTSSWTMAGAYLAFGPESEGWAVIGLGDFDGDSRTELLWRNSNSSQVSSWTMAGAYLNFGPESDGWSVVDIGDYDGDGLAELLWRNSITSQVSSWTMAGSFINFGIEGGGWHLKLF